MAPAHNLPIPLTSFIGRERELDEIERLLAGTRLLTLTGTGGAGKTRLALEAAHRALERFPDGVWLIDLAPLSDPDLVLQTVAAALGLSDQGDVPLAERVVARLAPLTALLVLDNCEHLLDSSARVAHTVLQRCPRARVLATSHELLAVPGEVAWPVRRLHCPIPTA